MNATTCYKFLTFLLPFLMTEQEKELQFNALPQVSKTAVGKDDMMKLIGGVSSATVRRDSPADPLHLPDPGAISDFTHSNICTPQMSAANYDSFGAVDLCLPTNQIAESNFVGQGQLFSSKYTPANATPETTNQINQSCEQMEPLLPRSGLASDLSSGGFTGGPANLGGRTERNPDEFEGACMSHSITKASDMGPSPVAGPGPDMPTVGDLTNMSGRKVLKPLISFPEDCCSAPQADQSNSLTWQLDQSDCSTPGEVTICHKLRPMVSCPSDFQIHTAQPPDHCIVTQADQSYSLHQSGDHLPVCNSKNGGLQCGVSVTGETSPVSSEQLYHKRRSKETELRNSLSKASDVQGLDDSLEEIQIDQLDEFAGGSSQSDCSVLHGGEPDFTFRYLHSKPSTLTDQSDPIVQIQSAPSLSATSCGQPDPEIHVHPTHLPNVSNQSDPKIQIQVNQLDSRSTQPCTGRRKVAPGLIRRSKQAFNCPYTQSTVQEGASKGYDTRSNLDTRPAQGGGEFNIPLEAYNVVTSNTVGSDRLNPANTKVTFSQGYSFFLSSNFQYTSVHS